MIDVIVTGGSGFIGSRLVKSLEKQGLKILSLSSKTLDITSLSSWLNLPKAKFVYHLAGKSFVPNSWDPKNKIFETNVLGTKNALSYCKNNKSKLCFASSYIYGIPDKLPLNEEDIVKPNNPYALSKYISEELCRFSSEFENISITILRLFNVFGPKQNSNFLIPSIIKQVNHKKRIEVRDLEPKRDFIYVDDVVEAFLSCLNSTDGFNIYNIGSGKSYSVKEAISLIQNINGKKLPVYSLQNERINEIDDVLADISKAKKFLNWIPKYTFKEGIEKVVLSDLKNK